MNCGELTAAYRELRVRGELEPGALRCCLRGATLAFPPKPPPPPLSPALAARRVELRRLAEERAYRALTRGVDPRSAASSRGGGGDDDRVGALLPKLSVGANVVLAMGTAFTAAFVGAGSVYDALHQRLAAGLLGLIVILFVEMALFVIRDTK